MFFESTSQGIILKVRLQPNSSCRRIAGIFTAADGSDFIKINVISIPEKGKANRELLEYLAKKLKLAKSDLQIIAGETDRHKKILIHADEKHILPALQTLAEEE